MNLHSSSSPSPVCLSNSLSAALGFHACHVPASAAMVAAQPESCLIAV